MVRGLEMRCKIILSIYVNISKTQVKHLNETRTYGAHKLTPYGEARLLMSNVEVCCLKFKFGQVILLRWNASAILVKANSIKNHSLQILVCRTIENDGYSKLLNFL